MQKDVSDADRQLLRQEIINVKGEMEKIDTEWKNRIETLRKETGGAIEFIEN